MEDERDTAPGVELRRFCLGAFAVSWVFFLTAAWMSHAFDNAPTRLVATLGIFGPAGTAVVLTHRAGGRARRDIWQRTLRGWTRVSAAMWAAILVVGIAPLLAAKLLPVTDTEVVAVELAGIGAVLVGGLVPGFGEEIGWRGYALDRLQMRWSPATSALLLGAVWATWHAPLFFVDGWYYHDELGVGSAWVFALYILAFSVILSAVYNASGRSILVAALLHTVSNMAFAIFGGDRGPTRDEFLAATLVLAALAAVSAIRTWRAPIERVAPAARLVRSTPRAA